MNKTSEQKAQLRQYANPLHTMTFPNVNMKYDFFFVPSLTYFIQNKTRSVYTRLLFDFPKYIRAQFRLTFRFVPLQKSADGTTERNVLHRFMNCQTKTRFFFALLRNVKIHFHFQCFKNNLLNSTRNNFVFLGKKIEFLVKIYDNSLQEIIVIRKISK